MLKHDRHSFYIPRRPRRIMIEPVIDGLKSLLDDKASRMDMKTVDMDFIRQKRDVASIQCDEGIATREDWWSGAGKRYFFKPTSTLPSWGTFRPDRFDITDPGNIRLCRPDHDRVVTYVCNPMDRMDMGDEAREILESSITSCSV